MNEQMKIPRLDELFEPAVRVLYGDNPTPDQVLAVHAVAGLGDAIAALPSLSDGEVRDVLVRAVKRLIPSGNRPEAKEGTNLDDNHKPQHRAHSNSVRR